MIVQLICIFILMMIDNLPKFRKKQNTSQEEMSAIIYVSQSPIASIENMRQLMSWNQFLPLILIFTKSITTDKLLIFMEIFTEDLNDFMNQPSE